MRDIYEINTTSTRPDTCTENEQVTLQARLFEKDPLSFYVKLHWQTDLVNFLQRFLHSLSLNWLLSHL